MRESSNASPLLSTPKIRSPLLSPKANKTKNNTIEKIQGARGKIDHLEFLTKQAIIMPNTVRKARNVT